MDQEGLFLATSILQQNINLNKRIYYSVVDARVNSSPHPFLFFSFFFFWCLLGLFPIFESPSPNELQGDGGLSITEHFASRVALPHQRTTRHEIIRKPKVTALFYKSKIRLWIIYINVSLPITVLTSAGRVIIAGVLGEGRAR